MSKKHIPFSRPIRFSDVTENVEPKLPRLESIFQEIKYERIRQDQKWGEQNHNPFVWLAILGEEVGEVNKAVLEANFSNKDYSEYRNELIQVAAVAVAMIECLYRNAEPSKI